MDFFVSQVVTISPCVTNTQYAFVNKCARLSFFTLSSQLLFCSFSLSLSLSLFHYLSYTNFSCTQSFSPSHSLSAFVTFTLMHGLKSSNKVCLLKNSSYSAFLFPRSWPFFLFFRQFIVLSISHFHSFVIVMYQNKLNILFQVSTV